MTALEEAVDKLRAELHALAERVRLDAVAEAFLADDHPIRDGDAVRFEDGFCTRIRNMSSDGKWTFMDRNGHHVEPFRVPPEDNIERLYTIAEVAEIVAQAVRLERIERQEAELAP